MKALILAAGLGTRLRPLTEKNPKALIKVGSLTLLERAVFYLQKNGIKDMAINVHYLAPQIVGFIAKNPQLNIKFIFEEKEILETGGAIKNAESFLKDSEPFVVFNVDVLTNANLNLALAFHKKNQALATLLVNNRNTARPFLVDASGNLAGHFDKKNNLKRIVLKKYQTPLREVGFMGIHIISPKIFELMPEDNCFSVVDLYLGLLAKGYLINVFEFNKAYWQDVGTVERWQQAENDLKNGLILN